MNVLEGLLGSTPASKSRVPRQGSCALQASISWPNWGGTESAGRAQQHVPAGAAQSAAQPAPRLLDPSSFSAHGPPGTT